MAQSIKIEAKSREGTGSAVARKLRRGGILPGIIYGESGKCVPIQMERHGFQQMLKHHRSESLILDLLLDGGNVRKVLLKDVQHDPLTDYVVHVDFLEVSMTKRMVVSIPLDMIGEPEGVTKGGGVMEVFLRAIEVECLPGDIVESFHVDVSGLLVGDSLHAKDIQMGPQFTLASDPDQAVVGVVAPRMEEEAPAEGEAAAAEPEVIGKKEAGEEEEAAAGEGKKESGKGKESKPAKE
ncbi:MAG: 50S ribosomal protein L25 [Lentisphaerae bacterium]|nr:50S ribosomal protein L25 [Lentisphaerota bacterium]